MEQNKRQNDLEHSLPPEDLLESLYSDLKSMQQDLQNIWPRLVSIEEQMDNQWSKNWERTSGELTRGTLALLAGNPDSAAIHFERFIAEDSNTEQKTELLMALAHSYLAQGYPEQAASYYGTVIGLSRNGVHYPPALFNLGRAFEMLGELEKRDVIWRELSEIYPEHPHARRTQMTQPKPQETAKAANTSENGPALETVSDPRMEN